MRFFHSSSNTYTRLIDAYTVLHDHLIINGFARSAPFASKLISFYTRFKATSTARKVFDKIPHTDRRRWVALIGSYARHGYYQEAMDVFEEMGRDGNDHDRIVLPSVLKCCSQLSDWKTVDKLHALVFRKEFDGDAFVACALVGMYSRCGKVEEAKRVFDGMVEKDFVPLNAMVLRYVQNGAVKEAFALVEEMKSLGVKPDIVTWNTLISGFSQANDGVAVSEVFRLMEADGVKPDVVSWTSVISGLVQNFRNMEAFSIFRQMLDAGLYPTSATISALLPASANIADLRRGKETHGYSVVMGFEEDLYVRSALIDMYAKCELISEALSLFLKMAERNTVTWNSMVFGYANHGYCNEAIGYLIRC